jgi:hypothetical protein
MDTGLNPTKGHTMANLGCSARFASLVVITVLAGVTARAQVNTVNSVATSEREFNDIPDADLTTVNTYPSLVSFTETGVSTATGFANRDVWRFSNDGGATAYQFQDTDYFSLSFELTLTGTPISPRKEAGILFNTVSSGDIQFIVNTDGNEVVQFGGISFYSFNANHGLSYNSGDTITLGLSYFLNDSGMNALQFSANGIDSPVFEFNPGVGIGTGSTLGGYFQIANDPANVLNGGSAVFGNIQIIPEPSMMTLVGLGCLALLIRRRGT